MKPELEMGCPNMRVGQCYSDGVRFEKVVRQCKRQRCGCVRLRLAMRTVAPDGASERTQRDREERERETTCKERERERERERMGRESKVMI